MTNSDIVLLAIGRLLSTSTGASEKAKYNFAAMASDFSLLIAQNSSVEDKLFASALDDFGKIVGYIA